LERDPVLTQTNEKKKNTWGKSANKLFMKVLLYPFSNSKNFYFVLIGKTHSSSESLNIPTLFWTMESFRGKIGLKNKADNRQ
jgi:hypothetical protein